MLLLFFFFLTTEKNIYFCHPTGEKDTLILSARSPNATIMSPGLLIFFSTRRVWEKSVGEYDRPSFGTVAQKFSSSLQKTCIMFKFYSEINFLLQNPSLPHGENTNFNVQQSVNKYNKNHLRDYLLYQINLWQMNLCNIPQV